MDCFYHTSVFQLTPITRNSPNPNIHAPEEPVELGRFALARKADLRQMYPNVQAMRWLARTADRRCSYPHIRIALPSNIRSIRYHCRGGLTKVSRKLHISIRISGYGRLSMPRESGLYWPSLNNDIVCAYSTRLASYRSGV
jgi:hypothetical protein